MGAHQERVKQENQFERENAELRARLEEAEEILRAIRNGEVDAVIVHTKQGNQIFTLSGAERSYRILVEKMNEGAATLSEDGTILYANECLARILREPLETVIGSSISRYIVPKEAKEFEAFFKLGKLGSSRGDFQLSARGGDIVPVYLSIGAVEVGGVHGACLLATDLSEQKTRRQLEALYEISKAIAGFETLEKTFPTLMALAAEVIPLRTAILTESRGGTLTTTTWHADDVSLEQANKAMALAKRFYGQLVGNQPPQVIPKLEEAHAIVLPLATHGRPAFGILFLQGWAAVDERSLAFADALTNLIAVAIDRYYAVREAEAKLAFERHKLEIIFRDSPAAMALWTGRELVFEMANPICQAAFGGRKLVGKPLLEAVPELANQPFPAFIEGVLETGEAYTGSEMLAKIQRTQDGPLEDRYYDFSYVRINDMAGAPYGVYGHASDVTERVLTRRALEMERDLRESFVSILTHDLRTPLTAAKMSVDLMLRKPDDPNVCKNTAKRIMISIDRIDKMIKDLLDVSRIRAGERLPLKIEEFDLREELKTVLGELSLVYGDRIVLTAVQEVRGYWSRDGIRRAVENLINNAVKYGYPDRPITVSLKQTPLTVQIAVHNEGSPIPPEDLSHLFEQFRRTKSAHTSGIRGWGLGLALVRGVVEAHGGTVKVESAAGTTFTLEIPKDARPKS